MATEATALPTGPLPHAAMDYALLRAEAVALVARLSGGRWTDFNEHDPGITLLEQLCWALTDLGYRSGFPVADLIAGSSDLPGPEELGQGAPVTRGDLQRALRDAGLPEGLVEAVVEPALPVWHHLASGELRIDLDPGEPGVVPVELRGVTAVRVPGDAEVPGLAQRLHRERLLGEDLEVGTLAWWDVEVHARVEVGAVDDPVGLLAAVLGALRARIAAPGEPAAPVVAVHASDLVRAVTDVPHVRAVRSLEVVGVARGQRGGVPVPAGSLPRLSRVSSITLLRGGLPMAVNVALAWERADVAIEPATPTLARREAGRRRDLARHRSIQRQLPALYGVGPAGLPASASPARRAQARQLQAYLLLFDQLLANAFAQLAHVGELLSADGESTRARFAQPVDDPVVTDADLLLDHGDALRAWLDGIVEPGGGSATRKRLLAHLLARFGEEIGDARLLLEEAPDAGILADRRAFLREVARLTGGRGTGRSLLDAGDIGGFERRLRLKLGPLQDRRLHVIEHILLRPVAEDDGQRALDGEEALPLLADVPAGEPWSLQVTVVVEDRGDRAQMEALVARTLLDELPAHLTPHLHWYGAEGWKVVDAAVATFVAAHAAYRRARLDGRAPVDVHLRHRDARDALAELLGLGGAWPLRDIPLPASLVVATGLPGDITLPYSQRGVRYELRHAASGARVYVDGSPVAAEGTGGPLTLRTPPVVVDARYRVMAVKLDAVDRATWLRGEVRVLEGVDPRLVARLRLPALDPALSSPPDDAARIADHGVAVEVEILDSQPGVTFELVDAAAGLDGAALSASAEGTGGTVVLTLPVATRDLDLRVRGRRVDPGTGIERAALLDAWLLLRVRADVRAAVRMTSGVLDHGADGQLEIEGPQAGTRYQAWSRDVRDREFLFDAGGPAVEVVDGSRTIRVAAPVGMPTGWTPRAELVAGQAKRIQLALGSFLHDALIVVTARRTHRLGRLDDAEAGWADSIARVRQAALVLLRPDPRVALRVIVPVSPTHTAGPWRLRDGQHGVAYTLLLGDEPVGPPGYFHQWHDAEPGETKGIDELRVEVDLAVAADPVPGAARPPAPLLDLPALPLGTTLTVRARKAMSGLEVTLASPLVLVAPPTVSVLAPDTPWGWGAVEVGPTRLGARYGLLVGEQALGTVRQGDGGVLQLEAGPLFGVAWLDLAEVRADGLVVEQRLAVAVDG